MSRSMPSNPFEVAKLTRFWTNCARLVLLQAFCQVWSSAPPIAMIASIPGVRVDVRHPDGTLTFHRLPASRPGPFSVSRLNRINWFMSSQGRLAGGTGAQPRSSVITTWPARWRGWRRRWQGGWRRRRPAGWRRRPGLVGRGDPRRRLRARARRGRARLTATTTTRIRWPTSRARSVKLRLLRAGHDPARTTAPRCTSATRSGTWSGGSTTDHAHGGKGLPRGCAGPGDPRQRRGCAAPGSIRLAELPARTRADYEEQRRRPRDVALRGYGGGNCR